MHRKWHVAGGALVVAGLMLPALALAQSGGHTQARTPPSAGTVLRLAMPDVSATVDPALVVDEENVQLASLMYSGLVRLDASYHIVLDAAARYSLSPDHLVYTFYLRKGLRFSNSDPIVADDFRYAITRSLDPAIKSPSAPTYLLDIQGASAYLNGKAKTVTGLKVLNGGTLQIRVRWPIPYFLLELTYPTSFALDRKAIQKLGPDDTTAWYSNPVGSGPYKLSSWVPNDRIVLTRNPYFSGSAPTVKTVTVSLSALSGQGMDLYQYVVKNLDVVGLPAYDAALRGQPGIRETKMLTIAGVYMSVTTKPFGSPHVRRALTMALNRQSLLHGTLSSIVTPFGGYVPPGEAGYDPHLRILPFNPKEARSELAVAGFPGGVNFPSVTLYYGVDPNNPTVARLIQSLAQSIAKSWHSVLKITADTRQLTLNTLYTKASSNSLPVYLSGWSADYPDGHDWLAGQWRTKAFNNNVGYSNPAFDRTVESADVTWNPRQRANLYDAAQQILVDHAAWIPLYIPHRLVYISPSVANLTLTGYGIIPRHGSWAQVQLRTVAAKGTIRL